jgi:misacylated tRNA(Ala) deacylase
MLFLENSYLKEFETQIKKVHDDKIILNQTAFYAKSGGQPGDTGNIIFNDIIINIIDTIYDNNKNIIHICEKKVDMNENLTVKGKINWSQRYKFMRMHSALHLLCSLIPFEVTGGQISFEKSRLDFNDQGKKIEKEEIEVKINNLVKEDLKINYEWITNEELDRRPDLVRTMSVKPPRTNNKIRLVKIGNVDLQPCGGTHVKSTKEIGEIKIGKIENKGKMNRRVNLLIND